MTAKKMKNLQDLFEDSLKDLYDAERQVVKALPKMVESASSQELKQSFKDHLQATERQVARIEEIFQKMDMPKRGKHCKGMEGLIEEGKEMMEESMEPQVLDAALIAAAQKIEHYEITGYGTARAFAQALGHSDVARILDMTAEEEGQTDKKLTALAEANINRKAMQ